MRRRKLFLTLAGLAVLVGVFVIWAQTKRITREKFHRITLQMTQSDVEAILGPPNDYRTSKTEPDPEDSEESIDAPFPTGPRPGSRTDVWLTDTARVLVSYDASGQVIFAGFRPERTQDTNLARKSIRMVKSLLEPFQDK